MSTKNLAGTHVVVIGGSSGIGKAVAAQAVEAGARVTIASRSKEKLAAAAAEIGGDVTTATVDVTSEDSVRALFAPIDSLDHLVVCPGDMANGSVYDVTAESIRACLDTKIVGQLLCVRYAGRKLASGGSIVMLAGAAGYKTFAEVSVTAAANAGIGALGRSLALELAPIRVNVVVAGMIDTPLWDFIPEPNKSAFFEQTAKTTPVGRIGRPADVAASVLHLLENTFVSGALVHVDGGALL